MRWQTWFDGLTLVPLDDGDTLLRGLIQDQSQLVGIINQVHNLNLTILSIEYDCLSICEKC